MSRRAELDEDTVAIAAIRLAEQERQKGRGETPQDHVGYYLIGAGHQALGQALGIPTSVGKRLALSVARHATATYLFAILALTALLAWPLFTFLIKSGNLPRWVIALGVTLTTVAVSRPAIGLIQWVCTLRVPPRTLARLDFKDGIPSECRTAIIVPTLLTAENGPALLEQLEIRFLANRSPNLLFGLLTDFPDAAQESLPGEEELLRSALEDIRRLNEKYNEHHDAVFFLLHRPRLWNPSERVWMAYERKRGKIEHFNRLVREGDTTPFSAREADLCALRTVRYVITLDTDTQLPPGTAAKLVGAMAHPLNRPRLDPVTHCVVEGYGILQPRLAVSLPSSRRSLFAAILAGEVGLDPYTREVSNFYHDVFGHGPFQGKGIYDVEVFDSAVRDRFPENRILSHDLIESCYARCGFISDVELLEDHPASYWADTRRRHRWVRGDWQIAEWMGPRVPSKTSPSTPNPLSLLSRWMIFDNLRRNWVPVALVVGLGFGWVALPLRATAWTGWLLAFYLLPELARTVYGLIIKGPLGGWSDHMRQAGRSQGRTWDATLLEIVALPYEVCLNLDAILRSFWRLWISRRGLLKWRTAADAERPTDQTPWQTLAALGATPLLVAGMGIVAYQAGSATTPGVATMIGLWFCGPSILWFISRTRVPHLTRLTTRDQQKIGDLAFRTWMYYDRFAGPEHNWIPPDNVQQTNDDQAAPRTSPTNLGMGLLSSFAACDLGFIPPGDVLDRTDRIITTFEKMDRLHGHFYNWYDTRSLQPLHPRYVSTVDSGNLLAALVTARSGLLELANSPPFLLRRFHCFAEMLNIVQTEARATAESHHEKPDGSGSARLTELRSLQKRFEAPPGSLILEPESIDK